MAVAAGWIFRDYVSAYLNYQHAPATVRALESQAHLSRQGQLYYYGADPKIVDKAKVQKDCAAVASEGLLGCYDGKRISILDITDPQFQSEEPVTAAHEMLHAAYDNLSKEQRQQAEKLLSNELKRQNNTDLNDRINKYPNRSAQLDEAFAILGSENSDQSLSPELANFYKRYFIDRAAVVASHQKFESQFDQLEARIKERKTQLDARKTQLDRDLANGNIARYNSQVDSYNTLVSEYNDLINQYNDLGQRFNKAISK